MFLRLKERFKPIAHDDYYELFDNYTVSEYVVDSAQYDLLLSLDGTRTLRQILDEYDETSQPTVSEFLEELTQIGALEHLSAPKERSFPCNYSTPYLEAVLWDVTSLCNLECTHCYVSEFFQEAKGRDLSTDEAFAVIDEMASMNVRDVSLTGGEPLMRKDLPAIIRHILNSNIRLASLFTNGIAVTEDFVGFLRQTVPYPSKFRIRISLDGMTPESNAVLRGDKTEPSRLFSRMTDAIKRFVDAGFFVSVGTGIHRFNVVEIPRMYSFMKDLGVSQWRMAVPKPIGRYRRTQSTIGADWPQILEAYRKLIDLHLDEVRIQDGEIVSPINIEIEQVFRTELVVKTLNTFQEDDIACFYHKNRCSLKANGDVVPCGYYDDIIAGNVRIGGLKQAWESSTMQQVKNLRVAEVTECKGCNLLSFCGTGCRAVAKKANGTIYCKDPYACYQAPFLKETTTQLLEKHGFTLGLSGKCLEFSVMEQELL